MTTASISTAGRSSGALATPPPIPRRFYSLDALRGIAALIVVVYHWSVFSYPRGSDTVASTGPLPFPQLLSRIYAEGWLAVDIFFSLSGFVFFWLYADVIAARTIGAGRFVAQRFSRLYPLHFVTLIFVLCLQAAVQLRFGHPFHYQVNDALNFFLNLFLVSGWFLGHEFSFNGPVWSVTVEVALYGAFFAACRLGFRRWWQLAVLAGAGAVVLETCQRNLGRGFLSFFLGGLCFYAYRELQVRGALPRKSGLPFILLAVVGACIAIEPRGKLIYDAYATVFGTKLYLLGHDYLGGIILWFTQMRFLPVVLFPLLILSLAILETARGEFLRAFAWLGDVSYATYLLHFPLQICFWAVASALSLDNIFQHGATLLVFLAVLLLLAHLTHHRFERPMQNWLRGKLIGDNLRSNRPLTEGLA